MGLSSPSADVICEAGRPPRRLRPGGGGGENVRPAVGASAGVWSHHAYAELGIHRRAEAARPEEKTRLKARTESIDNY
ncbi:MAG: hypothetical protein QXM16_06885 [Nitrososphaerota archaeon]